MGAELTLISHALCPYVQRAAIALAEKGVPFRRRDVDLAHKPGWFLAVSPLGRTPVLLVGDRPVFESAVILDYLDEAVAPALHPADPLERAEHRAWIAFASAVLDDIARLYAAPDEPALVNARTRLADHLGRVEERLLAEPWFDGQAFSLVDAAFGPVFRYLDAFERIGLDGWLDGRPKLVRWRHALALRPSVRDAVDASYPDRLMAFLEARDSALGRRLRDPAGQRLVATAS